MAHRLSRDKQLGEWALGRDEWPDRCPLYPGGLNGSTQHFILEGKDGVYSEGSAISSRFHSGREGGAVKSLAERGSRSNDRTGV